mmetsp:Transcript_49304/g.127165  ORF Transcript_49304/g.127165 Transcript_49304/m.127165 type:complete len:215 (-) Transcript_49304:546-1190(-)
MGLDEPPRSLGFLNTLVRVAFVPEAAGPYSRDACAARWVRIFVIPAAPVQEEGDADCVETDGHQAWLQEELHAGKPEAKPSPGNHHAQEREHVYGLTERVVHTLTFRAARERAEVHAPALLLRRDAARRCPGGSASCGRRLAPAALIHILLGGSLEGQGPEHDARLVGGAAFHTVSERLVREGNKTSRQGVDLDGSLSALSIDEHELGTIRLEV